MTCFFREARKLNLTSTISVIKHCTCRSKCDYVMEMSLFSSHVMLSFYSLQNIIQ